METTTQKQLRHWLQHHGPSALPATAIADPSQTSPAPDTERTAAYIDGTLCDTYESRRLTRRVISEPGAEQTVNELWQAPDGTYFARKRSQRGYGFMNVFERSIGHTLLFFVTFLPCYIVGIALFGAGVVGNVMAFLALAGVLSAVGGAVFPYIIAESLSDSESKLESVSAPELMERFNYRPPANWLNRNASRQAKQGGKELYDFENRYVLFDRSEQRCIGYDNKQELQTELQGVHEARLIRELLGK